MKLGLLIPQFPTQTHVAMWRVGHAMRQLGHDVQMLSTRRPAAAEQCHDFLVEESRRTIYAWPPAAGGALVGVLSSPIGALRCLGYALGLSESSFKTRLKTLAMLPAAAALKRTAHRLDLEHLFVHSCADAAHLVAMVKLLGGPGYSLRLGGDLDVYGTDHASKMRGATVVVPAARVNRDEIVERVGFPADRLIVSPLGVDTTRFVPGAADEEPGRPLRIASVARLNPTKGHLDTLAALRKTLDAGVRATLTLAGSGPDEQAIRDEIARLDLQDHVTLPGPADEARVIELLRSTDVFVLASFGWGEASPVAVIEAMGCGCAVVCSVVGGTPDMIDDRTDGLLFPQRDVDALAKHLIHLAHHPEERQRLGLAARAKVEREWDCRAVATRILDAIQTHMPSGRLAAESPQSPKNATPANAEVRHAG
ncbi:MAG: glycosyltransferase family 4 protein [Planctomycetota bacterium]